MPDIRPFRALRYAEPLVGDLAAVLCPPYDVIAQQEQVRLHLRHPQNAIRLELGRDMEGDDARVNRYHRAARTLAEWREAGIVAQEEQACLYLHRHTTPRGARLGLFAGLGLEPWGESVRPHERTLNGPKADRLLLFRHVGISTSPVMLLFRDEDQSVLNLWKQVMTDSPPALACSDGDDRHELWTITPGALQDRILRLLGDRPLTVADGHHRYETALAYGAERDRLADGSSEAPWASAFVCVLRMEDPALAVLPTHRLLKGTLPAAAEWLPELESGFSVTEEAWDTSDKAVEASLEAWVDELTDRGAIGLLLPGEKRRWTLVPRAALRDDLAARTGKASLARLAVVQLHHGLLAPVLGMTEAQWAKGGDLTYTREAHEVLIGLESGSFGAGFLLPRPTASEVADVAAEGAVMPQKSTFFDPKVPTGLLFMDLGGPIPAESTR
ncbi:MAG: DUF1015 domain-containing protein [Candidatus Sericytochromatia bacterium]|nr:DUF1015 domain-containing protein [Candidatus Sericytochromatia bacterium]